MTDGSRRSFFSIFLRPVWAPLTRKKMADVGNDATRAEDAAMWLPLGSLARFSPGEAVMVNENRQVLVFLPEGLCAVDTEAYRAGLGAPRRPLRIEPDGRLAMNPLGTWPPKAVLSVMTGTLTLNVETTQ